MITFDRKTYLMNIHKAIIKHLGREKNNYKNINFIFMIW